MNIREILKDSSSYPLSNWKSYLILGVILFITNLYWYINPDERLFYIVVPLASFVTEFLIVGYLIKIIKSTLDFENVLPKYNGWLNIIFNGFKGFLIIIAYFLPYIILIILLVAYFFINNLKFKSVDFLGLTDLIFFLYTIVIIPVIALALVNMAFDEDRLLSAFNFGEITGDIHELGWRNIITLYLLLGIIYIIIKAIPITLNYLLSWTDPIFVTLIKSMILIYIYIFTSRTVALIYRSSVVETSKSFLQEPPRE